MRVMGCEVQDARHRMSYRDLDIWKLARQMAIAVHRMTLQNLPNYRDLSAGLDLLGRKLNVFIDSVERLHRTNRGDISDPATRIAHLVS
jgi:hypothetical protein